MEKVKKIKLFFVGIIIVTIILITIGTIFFIRKKTSKCCFTSNK